MSDFWTWFWIVLSVILITWFLVLVEANEKDRKEHALQEYVA